MELAASSSTTVSATERLNLGGVSMSCLGRSLTRHTNTILDVQMEVQLFHLSPHRSPFWAQRSSFSYEEKGFHMQSVGSLKLVIVFVFSVSMTACRGLVIFCVTQNLTTNVFRWVFSTSPGAFCRISSSVAGLIPGERTSATPRSVLQISDRHLRRYPIHSVRYKSLLGDRRSTDKRPRTCSIPHIFGNVTNWAVKEWSKPFRPLQEGIRSFVQWETFLPACFFMGRYLCFRYRTNFPRCHALLRFVTSSLKGL